MQGIKHPLVVSIMFGSSLESCYWLLALKEKRKKRNFTGNQSTLEFLQHSLPKIFYFDSAPNGLDKVSTPTVHLHTPNVSYSAMPGQTLNLSVYAVDRLSQYASTVITSTVLSSHDASTQIGKSV